MVAKISARLRASRRVESAGRTIVVEAVAVALDIRRSSVGCVQGRRVSILYYVVTGGDYFRSAGLLFLDQVASEER